jgi:O-antigen ligase
MRDGEPASVTILRKDAAIINRGHFADPRISFMSVAGLRTLAILTGGVFLLLLILLHSPGYLASPYTLGAVIAAQLVFAAISRYRQSFFLILIAVFLWAGVSLPLQDEWLQGRWVVLAIGALAGFAIYMKDSNHYFSTFHLVAFFCALSAMVSAVVSAYPEESLLKALSLLLLFLYGCSGARLAAPALTPEKFFRGLLLACEALAYLSTGCYFLFHFEVFGNPNSLGAVMGVAVVPTLFWGVLAARSVGERRRRAFALLLAMLALLSSFSRASVAAAAVSCLLIGGMLGQFRMIVKGAAATVILAMIVVTVMPLPTDTPQWNGSESIVSLFLYKGKPASGVMGSRQGPWQQTWAVIQDHPWFGSGFGTSLTSDDWSQLIPVHSHFDSRVAREHGNSYLAIAEWVGLLGVVPFYFMVALMISNVRRVFSAVRRSGDTFSPAIPAAAIVAAGLVHATFEDWMFAVGYYLCVFFWAIAFILVDLLHEPRVAASGPMVLPISELPFLAAASGQ